MSFPELQSKSFTFHVPNHVFGKNLQSFSLPVKNRLEFRFAYEAMRMAGGSHRNVIWTGTMRSIVQWRNLSPNGVVCITSSQQLEILSR